MASSLQYRGEGDTKFKKLAVQSVTFSPDAVAEFLMYSAQVKMDDPDSAAELIEAAGKILAESANGIIECLRQELVKGWQTNPMNGDGGNYRLKRAWEGFERRLEDGFHTDVVV